MAEIDPEVLHGRWVHAHEEDEPGRMVFRPGDWRLPPSRGRRVFELRSDGTLLGSRPGPTDQATSETGHWRLLPGATLELEEDGKSQRRNVVEAAPDRLVLGT